MAAGSAVAVHHPGHHASNEDGGQGVSYHIREFRPEDITGLDSQQPQYTAESIKYVDRDNSFTGLAEGRVLFCAGVTAYWEGRGEAWAFFNRDLLPKYALKVIKSFKRYLRDIAPFQRIEASAEVDNESYQRFLVGLGFKKIVDCASRYFPDGKDATLYEMVKGI
jgi:hypothetical protein